METCWRILGLFLLMMHQGVCESEDIDVETKKRRFLLNDPNTLLSHVEALQQEMALLKSQVNSLKTDVNTCKKEVNNQTMEVNTCKTELNTLNMRVNSLNTEVNNQKQEVNASKTEVNTLKTDVNNLKTEVTTLNTEVSSQRTEVQSLQSQLINRNLEGTGSAYTVWGRKTCPVVNGTTTVYTGITGGNAFDKSGGGVNTLCLPHNPDDAPRDFPTKKVLSSFLYGSEYQFSYRTIARDYDVPCAVCHVDAATSVLMIPAKSTCPSGWNMQYNGFLVSDANVANFVAFDFVCLHNDAENLTQGAGPQNDEAHILYTVQASCGSLPCPPYREGQYITCVVCSL